MNFEKQLNELIAMRALQLSQQRNGSPGNPTDDWVQAEKEILHELNLRTHELYKKIDITPDGQLDIGVS